MVQQLHEPVQQPMVLCRQLPVLLPMACQVQDLQQVLHDHAPVMAVMRLCLLQQLLQGRIASCCLRLHCALLGWDTKQLLRRRLWQLCRRQHCSCSCSRIG